MLRMGAAIGWAESQLGYNFKHTYTSASRVTLWSVPLDVLHQLSGNQLYKQELSGLLMSLVLRELDDVEKAVTVRGCAGDHGRNLD